MKRIPSPNISQRPIHQFLYILQFNKLLKSNFCIIVFQRDLDFKISVNFEGEISLAYIRLISGLYPKF